MASMLSYLRRRFVKLTDPSDWPTNSSYTGKSITPETALQISTWWSCVRLIAETVATLPLGVFVRLPDGGKESRSGLALYSILHDSPNADQTAVEFWEGQIASLCVWGNSYARKEMEGKRLVGLTPISAATMDVKPDRDGVLQYTYTDEYRKVQELTEDDVFHIRGFGLGGYMGLSPVSYARQTLSVADAIAEAAGKSFKMGMRGSGFFHGPPGVKFDNTQRADFKRAFIDPYVGLDASAQVGLLEHGFEFKPVTILAKDAEMLMSWKFSVEEICRWLRVPPILIGHAAEGQTMWGCLPADTKVLTEDGPVPIDGVRPGTSVWSLDGSRFVKRAVRCVVMTGIHPVVTIKTRVRTLRCTANHKVLVRRKFSAPRPGPGGYRAVEWRNEWIRADEITSADYLIAANGVAGDSGQEVAPNGRRLTEKFMEFCGLYVAEGSVTDKGITIARHAAAPYMDAYRAAIQTEFHSRGYGFGDAETRVKRRVYLREDDRATSFRSVEAAAEMRSLGFVGTAHTKRVPGWVFGCARQYRLAFLRGYLDGDGHVSKEGWITWTSVSRDLIDDIRHLCMLTGIPCGVACDYPVPVWFDGSVRDPVGTVWQAWCYSTQHNIEIGSHDPRYQHRWATAEGSRRVGNYSAEYKGRGTGGARPGVGFDVVGAALMRVISIEKSAVAQPVYDLEIEDTQNFIADGVVVHNSGIEQIMIGWLTLGLRPYLTRVEQAIKKRLLTPAERKSLFAEFNVEGLMRADSQGRGELYSKMVQVGALTPNQICDKENFPRFEGGDVHLVNSTMVPLSQAGNRPARVQPAPGEPIPEDVP